MVLGRREGVLRTSMRGVGRDRPGPSGGVKESTTFVQTSGIISLGEVVLEIPAPMAVSVCWSVKKKKGISNGIKGIASVLKPATEKAPNPGTPNYLQNM